MRRGTTPTIVFNLNISPTLFESCYITFKNGENVIEKTLNDCTIEDNKLLLDLSQEDTLSFDSSSNVRIQIRAISNGQALASKILTTSVSGLLKDGVIE